MHLNLEDKFSVSPVFIHHSSGHRSVPYSLEGQERKSEWARSDLHILCVATFWMTSYSLLHVCLFTQRRWSVCHSSRTSDSKCSLLFHTWCSIRENSVTCIRHQLIELVSMILWENVYTHILSWRLVSRWQKGRGERWWGGWRETARQRNDLSLYKTKNDDEMMTANDCVCYEDQRYRRYSVSSMSVPSYWFVGVLILFTLISWLFTMITKCSKKRTPTIHISQFLLSFVLESCIRSTTKNRIKTAIYNCFQ